MRNSDLYKIATGCSSWRDFQRKLLPQNEKQKGDLFEELVRAYLNWDPKYVSKLKDVWLYREVPPHVRKKLNLPSTDKGIDLVAETKDGEFWAIQCKYRQNTDTSLSFTELSTFTAVTFHVCHGITFGLVCTTTERFTDIHKDQNNIGFCSLDVWQGLGGEFFEHLRKNTIQRSKSRKAKAPRPHQEDAIKAAKQYFVTENQTRGKLIMPCGSGKSLTGYWIAEALDARRIVIVVPSLSLIRQTLEVWLGEIVAKGRHHSYACICSDDSAGRPEDDALAVLRQDTGIPCLTDTDPGKISAFLKKKHAGMTIVFTTYQSGEALSKAARSAKFHFDLGIMDEAHKTVGSTDKLFSLLLHDANLLIRRRIFMTATERFYKFKSDNVLSMDNAKIYGKTFHLLSFKRALEDKILSRYVVLFPFVSRRDVAEMIRKNALVTPAKSERGQEIEAEMLASLIALRNAMKKYPIRHAISFHSSIKRAKTFEEQNALFNQNHQDFGDVMAFHVSGRTPTGERARIIDEFKKAKRGLITNARCLTEGVDVPLIDCVLFSDPRRSTVDIVQAVGRALRPADAKQFGYIIVPIFYETDDSESAIRDSAFEKVIGILRALGSNDETIVEYFKTIIDGKPREKGRNIEFDIDERLAQRIDASLFINAIDAKIWGGMKSLVPWRNFEEARTFSRSLGLRSKDEWRKYYTGILKKNVAWPADIPTNPNKNYSDEGWRSWNDWLDTGRMHGRKRPLLSFNEARFFAHGLQLRKRDDWKKYCRGALPLKGTLPINIPRNPDEHYAKQGWKGWGNWLGTNVVASQDRIFLPFHLARAFVRRLHLQNRAEWRKYCKGKLLNKVEKPLGIHTNPGTFYKGKGWRNMGDWLGTGIVSTRDRTYLPFNRARSIACGLGLRGKTQWSKFHKDNLKKMQKIPASPGKYYAGKGWKDWGHWLGTGNKSVNNRHFLPFKKARAYVRKLGLKSQSEWFEFRKSKPPNKKSLPANIPTNPNTEYKATGWKGYRDWLGTS